MTTTIQPYVTSPVATAERRQTADPWDAPYFGGTVYFEDRASATWPPLGRVLLWRHPSR
ncbi:MAG TPA: hypothetical protein VGP82_16805 [Ktedonobacterales bacterium]|nr:hypothetical protein [Ktedonobacterales bacterium]